MIKKLNYITKLNFGDTLEVLKKVLYNRMINDKETELNLLANY